MTATTAPAAVTGTRPGGAVMTQRQITLVILALMAGMFLSALDQTIVGTAIRTIGDDLHGLDQQAWVTTAYLITSTIATPIYGKLSDLFGRRPLYIFGIGVFILGSLLSSFSTSMIMLAAFRGFQGIGAGALMSLPLAIMGDMLAPRERAKYQGYFLAVFGISSVVGPLIGGVFSGADQILWIAGWRWVFLVNVPVGIVALAMVLIFLHLPRFHRAERPRIDWWGATSVIVALVPLLLVAEQGREWGWTSAAAFICYALSAIGLAAFLIVERHMGDDAIIPLKLFGSHTFSMATILGFLVGFAMFGAMLTIPLYLQIVKGLTPTESGFATLPMVLGLMISSIVSGQIVARTGKYRIFPVTGTFVTAAGYVVLTFITVDKPLWFLMIGMFLIGGGLGQLMQSLTLATQNSVAGRDMGVATSASTFFRQIGGTMGTAVLLSVLFTVMPTNIQSAMGDRDDLTSALDAALTPSVATASANKGVMEEIWTPITTPLTANIQKQLDQGTTQALGAADTAVTDQVTQAVQQEVAAGRVPAAQQQAVIDQQVAQATPQAHEQALTAAADKTHTTVQDGKLVVDWSNEGQRTYWVDQVAPKLADQIADRDSSGSSSSDQSSDTSFLNGADARLTRPFMTGFNASAVTIYWVGLAVILAAFVLSWFFKVPPLRDRSALQEAADNAAVGDDGADDLHAAAAQAAVTTGSPVVPSTGEIQVQDPGARAAGDDGSGRAGAGGSLRDTAGRDASRGAEDKSADRPAGTTAADGASVTGSAPAAPHDGTHRGSPDPEEGVHAPADADSRPVGTHEALIDAVDAEVSTGAETTGRVPGDLDAPATGSSAPAPGSDSPTAVTGEHADPRDPGADDRPHGTHRA
ncbi:DHA2 family efflux MFS transporter permease subunit [Brachybacterium sp. AOP25-B2-12]|uniref:DHA2 family efflux MFS transporter permease subunit n=1 Tax=Brachybacterium sp. AOP25-B2-12 TaxID=3457710 RepID=UPI004034BABB